MDPKPLGPAGEQGWRETTPVVLDEDEWTAAIEEIIGRDFFPDSTDTKRRECTVDVTGLSLDEFLRRYTSEDNASFRDILDKGNAKRRKKLAHLMLPPAPQQPRSRRKYEPANMLMYDGGTRSSLPLSLVEAGNIHKREKKSIHHEATSLDAMPDVSEGPEPGGTPVKVKEVKEVKEGYSLLETPSFDPDEDGVPIITWGTIEATPRRIDDEDEGGDEPTRPGFAMQGTPRREQLAHALGARGTPHGLFPRNNALQTPRSLANSLSAAQMVHSMSPAARRLAHNLKRGTIGGKVPSIFRRPPSSWDDAP
jgi:protein DGCR14